MAPSVTDEDPEKKKKKEEKAKEKELKKLKAAQKAEAGKAAQAAKASQPSKKAEQRAKKTDPSSADAEAESVDPPTVPGEKKCLSQQMAKTYNPQAVEASWYAWWEKSGYFVADSDSKKPPFVIVIPPPNVTGALHIGHALTIAVEDTLVRWRRMNGYNTLWVPGYDHAGIATQVVVEKKIKLERGLTRHDLGREAFISEVRKWTDQYGGRINKQLRRVGASLDWSRECFTMDEKRSIAVTEAFVRLHKENLIYRDNRIVNWDSVLRTAISDIEVDYIDLAGRTLRQVPGYDSPVEFGVLTSFAYPIEGGEGEIVVATTRPETMLGDTAVAVHPADERYKKFHGKFAVHPFNSRRIPIICDPEAVDMSFGTGAVKITPAHDPDDFATGKRHNLEFINILTDDGKINSKGGKDWEGLRRFDARLLVKKALIEKGLYRGVIDNPMRLGVCSRSKDVVEPVIKPQWYVNCDGMAKAACAAVRNGELEILPKQFEDTWFRWLENSRPWCISRQLWWGHRVPAWYVTLEDDELKDCGAYDDRWIVGRDAEEANRLASEKYRGNKYELQQDPDVLDTWFSSGLFPFSVMGWPANTADLQEFYPTWLLETGHDILFFWVARMVQMGIQLTGRSPFKQVLLHAMIRDAHGRKMSKSLGNVIDPLQIIDGITLEELQKTLESGNLDPGEVKKAKAGQKADFPNGIAECGADALRFSLVAYTAQSININLDIQRVVGYRHWCNKLWNAIRFAMMNLGGDFVPSSSLDVTSLPFGCQWILSLLNKAVMRTNSSLEAMDLSSAGTAVHSWWLYQLCDVFIEISKPVLLGDDNDPKAASVKKLTRDTLWVCLDTGLRLLHPFMPYLTEELWQRLPQKAGDVAKSSIVIASYPTATKEWENVEVEDKFPILESVVRSARSMRMTYGVQPKQKCGLSVLCRTPEATAIVREGSAIVGTLATLSSVEILTDNDAPPAGCAVAIVNEHVTAYLLLSGLVDAELEISKLQRKKEEAIRSQEVMSKKMNVAGYSEKVPAAVQEENLNKIGKYNAELATIKEAIENFEKLRISSS